MGTIDVIFAIISRLPIEQMLFAPPRPEPIVMQATPHEKTVQPPVTIAEETKVVVAIHPKVGVSEYAGTSQISSAGRACLVCGNDHFSTAAGFLNEAKRFALEGSVDHPEVLDRIARAEDELNAFERLDGAADKVIQLPENEKAVMDKMLVASRHLRHMLKEVSSVPDLEQVGAEAIEKRKEFRTEMFKLHFGQMKAKEEVHA